MFFTAVAISLFALTGAGEAIEADFVIRGAKIYDGSGSPGVRGDIAIRGDRIVAIGTFETKGKPREIDAAKLVAAPGFIDLHNHSDRPIVKPETRKNINYLMQGATTIVTGNCGAGQVDVADYLKLIDQFGAGTNVVHLIPHGSVRGRVMLDGARTSTKAELEQMKQKVAQSMQEGAWGMSTGLIYTPGSFANTEELVELSKVVAAHGGIYASHMRNENIRLLESVEETLEIGKRAKLPVHISHFKASGQASWGLAAEAVRIVQAARDAGQIVTADQYPYIASSTSLAAMVIPTKYRTGDKFKSALKDAEELEKLRTAIAASIKKRSGGKSLVVAGYKANRTFQGKNMAELAEQEDKDIVDLILDMQIEGGAQMVNFGMNEAEVRMIMRQSFVATASDGGAKLLTDNNQPHPRSYGCFPRKIGHYSIAGKVLSLAQAIRSSSGLPADILSLPQRGYLKEGYYADIVLFDAKTFIDKATFDKPHQYAAGVHSLFVNGVLAIEEGKATEALAGKALRHESSVKEN